MYFITIVVRVVLTGRVIATAPLLFLQQVPFDLSSLVEDTPTDQRPGGPEESLSTPKELVYLPLTATAKSIDNILCLLVKVTIIVIIIVRN